MAWSRHSEDHKQAAAALRSGDLRAAMLDAMDAAPKHRKVRKAEPRKEYGLELFYKALFRGDNETELRSFTQWYDTPRARDNAEQAAIKSNYNGHPRYVRVERLER